MKHTKLLIINVVLFFIIMIVCLILGLVVLKSLGELGSIITPGLPAIAQEEEDKIPPQISNIEIVDVSTTSAIVIWKTDEVADSLINFGTDKRYGIVRDPRPDKTSHMIVIDDLEEGKEYFFRITSTDVDGNQGISSDYSFETPREKPMLGEGDMGIEGMGGGKQCEVTQILETIEEIIEEETLEEIQQQIRVIAVQEIEPPTIILDMAEVEVGTDYAIIRWATDKEADSMVALATESDYDETSDDPYTWKVGEPDVYVLEHEILVPNLKPATVYHFQVISKSALDLTGRSSDKTFKTKSILPEIYNLNLSKIEEDSVTITFTTNVPCSTMVEYTNLDSGEAKLEGNSNYFVAHRIQLTNLLYDTYYSAMVRVENEEGDRTESEILTFITTKDEIPPVISKVSTESTLYPGSDNKVQTIVSWETDEAAVCQLFYHQGLITIDEGESLPLEEELAIKHVQVATSFIPSAVYKFWIICADEVGNQDRSADYTMLTPTQEESIIDIIIKNFESTFGWVNKLRG